MPTLECPICHRKVVYANREEVPFRPFCSSRCRLIDLGRWLNEEYRISEPLPGPEADPGELDGDVPEQDQEVE
jgi:uncharacterized protein